MGRKVQGCNEVTVLGLNHGLVTHSVVELAKPADSSGEVGGLILGPELKEEGNIDLSYHKQPERIYSYSTSYSDLYCTSGFLTEGFRAGGFRDGCRTHVRSCDACAVDGFGFTAWND